MKKTVLCTLAAGLLAHSVSAQLESNKTFVKTRDSLSSNMLLASGGRPRRGQRSQGRDLNSTVSIAPYYRVMHNKSEVGTAFGSGQELSDNQKSMIGVTQGYGSSSKDRALSLYGPAVDAISGGNPSEAMYGDMTFNPSYKECGAHIGYRQNLGFIAKGLFLTVDAPFASIKTTLAPTFDATASANTTDGVAGKTLAQFFAGSTFAKAAEARQAPLRRSLIDGDKHVKTGIADIKFGLGFKLFRAKGAFGFGALTLTIPTGKTTDETHLFEPRLGSGHIALGLRLDGMKSLYKNNGHRIGARATFDYRYFFEGEEERTLGVHNHWYNTLVSGGHYRLLAEAGGSQVVPGANILTRTVSVTPGHAIDGVVGLSYGYKQFSAALNYNLYARDGEVVTLTPKSKWIDSKYGFFAPGGDLTTAGGMVVGKNGHTTGGAIAQEADTSAIATDSSGAAVGSDNVAEHYVSTKACTAHSDITHKLGVSAGWQLSLLGKPCHLSLGAEYEFNRPTKNYGLRTMGLWGKINIGF
jgi:hypothetical protein